MFIPRHKVFHNILFLLIFSKFVFCHLTDASECLGCDNIVHSVAIKAAEKNTKDHTTFPPANMSHCSAWSSGDTIKCLQSFFAVSSLHCTYHFSLLTSTHLLL